MSTEHTLRAAIHEPLRQLREQHAAALDGLIGTLVDAAVEAGHAEAAEARALAEQAARERSESSLSKLKADAEVALAAAVRQARAEGEQVLASALRKTRAEADRALATSVANAREAEREEHFARLSRLFEGIRALDEAGSLTEVLEKLLEFTSQEAPRAAVLLVRGERLQGWRFVGFGDSAPDPRGVELRSDGVGVIVEAVRAKQAKTSGPELSGFGFAPLPTGRTGLAVPLEVGGQVVAVVYADDATAEAGAGPASWTGSVEILVRYGARCLQGLMAVHAGAA